MAAKTNSSKTRRAAPLPSDDVVRARINKTVKKEATRVLAKIGLTPSSAYRMMMMRIATEKALPFDPHVPNEKTRKAITAARRGELKKVDSLSELFDDLNA